MCKYTNRFIPLATSLPEDPEVKKVIDQTIQKANEINKKRIQQAGLNQPTTTLQDVAGSQKCQECHTDQMKLWQGSKHAKAWGTLEKKNQQFNEDCLLCHVTLPFYDADKVKAGNFLLMMPKSLKNVGCEACHGPGAAHSAGKGKIPVARPDEKVCLQCHTPEHDDHFIFSEKAKKLKCSLVPLAEKVQEVEKKPAGKIAEEKEVQKAQTKLPVQGEKNQEDKEGKKENTKKDEEKKQESQSALTESEKPELTASEDNPFEPVIRPRKKKTANKKQ